MIVAGLESIKQVMPDWPEWYVVVAVVALGQSLDLSPPAPHSHRRHSFRMKGS